MEEREDIVPWQCGDGGSEAAERYWGPNLFCIDEQPTPLFSQLPPPPQYLNHTLLIHTGSLFYEHGSYVPRFLECDNS